MPILEFIRNGTDVLSNSEECKQNCFSAREEQTTQNHDCFGVSYLSGANCKSSNRFQGCFWKEVNGELTGTWILAATPCSQYVTHYYYALLCWWQLMIHINLAYCLPHIVKPTVLGDLQLSEPVKCILSVMSTKKITTFIYPILHHSMKTYSIEYVEINALSLALVGGE